MTGKREKLPERQIFIPSGRRPKKTSFDRNPKAVLKTKAEKEFFWPKARQILLLEAEQTFFKQKKQNQKKSCVSEKSEIFDF